MAHQVHWENFGFRCVYHGDVSFADLLQVYEEVCGNTRFDAARYAIFDFLEVASHSVNQAQAEEMAGLHYAQDLTNGRLVRVALAQDPGAIALLNAWKSMHPNPERVAVCHTLDEARAWIAETTAQLSPKPLRSLQYMHH